MCCNGNLVIKCISFYLAKMFFLRHFTGKKSMKSDRFKRWTNSVYSLNLWNVFLRLKTRKLCWVVDLQHSLFLVDWTAAFIVSNLQQSFILSMQGVTVEREKLFFNGNKPPAEPEPGLVLNLSFWEYRAHTQKHRRTAQIWDFLMVYLMMVFMMYCFTTCHFNEFIKEEQVWICFPHSNYICFPHSNYTCGLKHKSCNQ